MKIKIKNKMLRAAYKGSYYTIVGAGGDQQKWKDSYNNIFNILDIGEITKWISFTGKDMNVEFNLTGSNSYPDDLNFLAFPLDGLNSDKLTVIKILLKDRWFDDIVINLSWKKEYENENENRFDRSAFRQSYRD